MEIGENYVKQHLLQAINFVELVAPLEGWSIK